MPHTYGLPAFALKAIGGLLIYALIVTLRPQLLQLTHRLSRMFMLSALFGGRSLHYRPVVFIPLGSATGSNYSACSLRHTCHCHGSFHSKKRHRKKLYALNQATSP